MDFSVIHEYLPMYTEAAKLTVRLGIAGIAISSLVGLFCAMVQYFKIPVLRQIAAIYFGSNRNIACTAEIA
jgi:polar amino acid transport system permease protein